MGGRLTADPLRTHAGNEEVITEILIEDRRGVFRGQVEIISIRVPMVTDLGLYLVDSLIICVRLMVSSLDCRTAGLLSKSQFRSPSSTNSDDRWRAINSHMVSRTWLEAEGVSNSERLISEEIHF